MVVGQIQSLVFVSNVPHVLIMTCAKRVSKNRLTTALILCSSSRVLNILLHTARVVRLLDSVAGRVANGLVAVGLAEVDGGDVVGPDMEMGQAGVALVVVEAQQEVGGKAAVEVDTGAKLRIILQQKQERQLEVVRMALSGVCRLLVTRTILTDRLLARAKHSSRRGK